MQMCTVILQCTHLPQLQGARRTILTSTLEASKWLRQHGSHLSRTKQLAIGTPLPEDAMYKQSVNRWPGAFSQVDYYQWKLERRYERSMTYKVRSPATAAK
jgi:hypothetical protein